MSLRSTRGLAWAVPLFFVLWGCDARDFPEGPKNLVDSPFTPQLLLNGDISITARDDNPQVAAYTFINDMSWTWAMPGAGFLCDPSSAVTFSLCNQTYSTGFSAGRDYLALSAVPNGRAPFFHAMTALGSGRESEATFVPLYAVRQPPGIYFFTCASSTNPDACRTSTFPAVFPSVSLPMDGNGHLQSISLDMLRVTNDVYPAGGTERRLGGRITIHPEANLRAIPVHVHVFDNSRDDVFRKQLAESLIDTYDDKGNVRTTYSWDAANDVTTAYLFRPINAEPSRGLSERSFLECGVQLRLVSVSFHALPNDLLVNGEIVPNCGNCTQSDCQNFVNDTPISDPGRPAFSKIGAHIRSFFDKTSSAEPKMPRGIHVVFIDKVRDRSNNVAGDGFACAASIANGAVTVPPFALVADFDRSNDIHEIAHVLGMNHAQITLSNTTGLLPLDCLQVRAKAQTIIDLAE